MVSQGLLRAVLGKPGLSEECSCAELSWQSPACAAPHPNPLLPLLDPAEPDKSPKCSRTIMKNAVQQRSTRNEGLNLEHIICLIIWRHISKQCMRMEFAAPAEVTPNVLYLLQIPF